MCMTKDEGINCVYDEPSHVVILGAGASVASVLHNPEPSGKSLPQMSNFVDIVGLSNILQADGNFEAQYSSVHAQNPNSPLLREVEERVKNYFRGLKLPKTPTIYDYLVLSLRRKDLIATFNWDPFLYQAFSRNRTLGEMPNLCFLHGSVSIGYSRVEQKAGPAGWFSKSTGNEYVPTKLLYPVAQKDYNNDEFIRREWDRLKLWLKNSKRLTIFGYSAPETDIEAVGLMSNAWGDLNQRNLEEVEMIDTLAEDVVRKRWNKFIHTHHYNYCTNYFESSLALFPRRTGEAFIHQVLPSSEEEALQEPNPVPRRFDSLDQMWDWFQPLIHAEIK